MIHGDSLAQVVKDTTILKEVIVNVADTVTNYVYIKEVPMSDGWSTDTWINLLSAGITFLAVLVAFGGKEFINWWNRIDLDINVATNPLIKNVIYRGVAGIHCIDCCLLIEDKKGKKLVKNVKIKVKRFSNKANNNIVIERLHGEAVLEWQTINNEKTKLSFLKKQEIILGKFTYNTNIDNFMPSIVTTHPVSWTGKVGKELKIFELEVIADNYFSNKMFYFQVYNDGNKLLELHDAINHIHIMKVNHIEDFREPTLDNNYDNEVE